MDQQDPDSTSPKLKRGTFIKIAGLTLSGTLLGLRSGRSANILISAHVYDLFGFPVSGAIVSLVTGYSFLKDDGLQVTGSVKQVVSNSTGFFTIAFSNPQQDLSLRIKFENELRQITVQQITGTNIPFYNAEVWSSDKNTKVNELALNGLLGNVNVYIDPSRMYMWNYFVRNHIDLIDSLQNHPMNLYEQCEPWEGNHNDPDNPGKCVNDVKEGNGHCDDHYYDPNMDPFKKINIPWGSNRGVIPFTAAEAKVYHTLTENENKRDGKFDNDWEWEIVLEPQYAYLPNTHNKKIDDVPDAPDHPELALHCEMCSWFMERKITGTNNYTSTSTNISRHHTTNKDFKDSFLGKRVWLTGTWTIDSGHDAFNEFHPVYWIVPFVGGWRRFCASELVRIHLTNSGALSVINDQINNSPNSLLDTLNATFEIAMTAKSSSDAHKFYVGTIIHLNKFGFNYAFPNPGDVANSLNETDFQRLLPLKGMVAEIKRRYTLIYNQLTALGSGYLIFSSMLFVYEATDIILQADSIHLHRPASLVAAPGLPIQVSLIRQVSAMHELIVDDGHLPLKTAYKDIFTQMKSGSPITADQIAGYYADVSVRLISYGMYAEDDPRHSKNRDDHYNWALPRAKSNTDLLVNSINVRLDDLWKDAFPFARKI